jgi:TolB-like protein/class 3 adenylate cyclase/Tfp pilus assembly protein PilF
MSDATEQRKLAAIMFTDMVGYSALSQNNPKVAVELLEEHREILREIFPKFNGTEIKTIGDAFLVEFNSALEAAQCAIAIQRALAKRDADAPAERQIQVRIGIHIGDVVYRGGDVYGDGVNIASRIEPLADAGGICVSMDVERQIRNALETRFEKLAPTELKNISVAMDLFRIVLPWETKASPWKSESRNQRQSGSDKSEIGARSGPGPAKWIAITALILLATVIGLWWMTHSRKTVTPRQSEAATVIPEKSVAVLPFENLSRDLDNAFFTDGVQDQVLTNLSQIADLKVISRTSVMQYKTGTARNLREIGQQLGVAHVVEGTVQRAANKVRVSAQLIDARNDAHVWAQTYDRDLADVFAIQSEIAKAIADQLQAKLSPNEKKAIEQPPTTDLAAFDLYSRAKSLLLTTRFSATNEAEVRKAIELLDEAVKRDPSFFDAYFQLAFAHESLYGVFGDHTPARLALAEAAEQAARRLRPDAGETHLARAQFLYNGRRDYAGALAELESVRRTSPNDPRIFELTGYILRRRGQQEEGLRNLQRAAELDPRNFGTLQQIAISYQNLRRYADAISTYDRVLSIVPDNVETRANRGLVELCWKGDTRPLHQTIDSILAQGPSAIGPAADTWFTCALAEHDAAAAERALVALGDNPWAFEGAINLSHSFGEGLLARMTKDEARAHAAFEAARAQQEKRVEAQPDFGPTLCVLAMIDAALGRKELALEEGRRAIALTPIEKDVINGSVVVAYFAVTAAWAGDKELGLQQLETGLRAPAASLALSYGSLKLLPFWDPLRGDPRFEKIVQSLAPK